MIINSPEAMFTLGQQLAQEHKKILLHGELGAGKTLFTKGFAKGLSLDETHVQSPTYTYVNIYDDTLLHIDLYRLEQYSDLVEKGIADLIDQYEYIIIERPKFFEEVEYTDFLEIKIEKTGEEERTLTIS